MRYDKTSWSKSECFLEVYNNNVRSITSSGMVWKYYPNINLEICLGKVSAGVWREVSIDYAFSMVKKNPCKLPNKIFV